MTTAHLGGPILDPVLYDYYSCAPLEPPRPDQTAAPGAPGARPPYGTRAADERARETAPGVYRGGYPFMALAKKHGVAYEDVLGYVEWRGHGSWKDGGPVGKGSECCKYIPLALVNEIDLLMRQPVWARGK